MLPEIVADRCVHSLLVEASCQACIGSCPRQAWILNDEQLGIDADRCDGCGLCAAACPEGAIQTHIETELRQGRDGAMVLLGCEHSALPEEMGLVPCLHSVSLETLFSLYRQGVDTVIACRADCEVCPRGAAPHLQTRLADMNRLLDNRSLPGMNYRPTEPAEWLALYHTHPVIPIGGSGNRRQFFRRLAQVLLDGPVSPDSGVQGTDARFEPAGSILPSDSPGQMVPFLPQIEPDRCDACSACIKLCPHNALSLATDGTAYHIHPDRCSGCGICVDLCEQSAIRVQTWATPEIVTVPLVAQKCRDCGAPYFTTGAHPAGDGLCRICHRHRHLRTLFQVLD